MKCRNSYNRLSINARAVVSFCLVYLLLSWASTGFSQRLQRVQKLISPAYEFTALSGYHGGWQSSLFYRNQWPGIPSTYIFTGAGVDTYLKRLKSGIGLNLGLTRMGSGAVASKEISTHIAPRFRLGDRLQLLTGVALNYTNVKVSHDDFYFPIPTFPPSPSSYARPSNDRAHWLNASVGAGIIWHHFMLVAQSHYATGFKPLQYVWEEINPPLDRLWQVYATNRFHITKVFSIAPSASLVRQGDLHYETFSLNVSLFNFKFGGSYMLDRGFGIQAGYDIKGIALLSYSYDAFQFENHRGKTTLGSHELGLRFTLFGKSEKDIAYKDLPIL